MPFSHLPDDPGAAPAILDRLYDHVARVFLSRQHPVTGLLPAATAVTVHGNYTHAWMRDNVYTLLAPWALSLAFRRRGDRPTRARLLEQAVVKTMRGLLQAMMRQAHKVEAFKASQDPLDSLHALYGSSTGEPVAPDDGWGHLQIDATSLYILMLAQMTRAGLPILLTMDEVAFVQNLVHYIGPAYRIADFGMWERGHKINDGRAELNASSIGMAKAALEAIQGLDMFGDDPGGDAAVRRAVIHVVPDEVARARDTLSALLPRESGSKEVDAAVLSIIGWPAFAVEDEALAARTSDEIATKLEGRWGAKRFLRDGHQTALEDHNRLHYEAGELERFAGIESEWPLFFTYRYVTALMTGDRAVATRYRERLAPLFVRVGDEALLPELYIVPEEDVAAERASPGSVARVPNENVPLLWAQSLYLIGYLLDAGLLAPADIDPLGRRTRIKARPPAEVRLIVLAEDEGVAAQLAAQGVAAQRHEPGGPVTVSSSDALTAVLGRLGACEALGLTGRPGRRLGSLITAQAFRLSGQATVFAPAFTGEDGFYFGFDSRIIAERLVTEIAYINRSWAWAEPPLMVFPVTRAMTLTAGFEDLAATLRDLLTGALAAEVAVCGATLARAVADAHTLSLDHEPPAPPIRFRDWAAGLPDAAALVVPVPEVGSPERLELVYGAAALMGRWSVVRRCAHLLGRHDERLQDAVKEMVVRQKRVILGPADDPDSGVDLPLDNAQVIERLARVFAGDPCRDMLAEEMVLACGMLIKKSPDLFGHCLSLRPLDMLDLLIRTVQRDGGDAASASELLAGECPHAVQVRLRRAIAGCPGMTGDFCLPTLARVESDMPLFGLESDDAAWAGRVLAGAGDWAAWRDATGVFLPLPDDFFARVWTILHHCDTLVIADPAEETHRLDAVILRADATPAEREFARAVEARLDRIRDPAYRQATVEALWAVSEVLRARPSLAVRGTLAVDALLSQAVAGLGIADVAEAWQRFYSLSPTEVAERVAAALLDATRAEALVTAA